MKLLTSNSTGDLALTCIYTRPASCAGTMIQNQKNRTNRTDRTNRNNRTSIRTGQSYTEQSCIVLLHTFILFYYHKRELVYGFANSVWLVWLPAFKDWLLNLSAALASWTLTPMLLGESGMQNTREEKKMYNTADISFLLLCFWATL